MKVKTFWLISLKIIGLFLVLSGVNVIIYSLSTVTMVLDMRGERVFILMVIALIAVYCFILWLFVFKTSWLIKKLHLEKGFEDEKIELNIQLSNILSIAIIVIGGIMIIDSLPQLCKQIFTFFQSKALWIQNPTTGWIILYFVEAILGYLLMTNSKQITEFINKRACSDKEMENDG